jgi:hypothetical protein
VILGSISGNYYKWSQDFFASTAYYSFQYGIIEWLPIPSSITELKTYYEYYTSFGGYPFAGVMFNINKHFCLSANTGAYFLYSIGSRTIIENTNIKYQNKITAFIIDFYSPINDVSLICRF